MPQVRLEAVLVQLSRPVQAERAGADRHRPEQDAAIAVAGDRHLGLLAGLRPAVAQRRRLGEDCGVGEQDDGARAPGQPAPQPPFACRQVGERRERTKRGCFQR